MLCIHLTLISYLSNVPVVMPSGKRERGERERGRGREGGRKGEREREREREGGGGRERERGRRERGRGERERGREREEERERGWSSECVTSEYYGLRFFSLRDFVLFFPSFKCGRDPHEPILCEVSSLIVL